MTPIAHIHTSFPSKFGIPRQSNIVSNLPATIVFTPEYRNIEALRGIEDFDYLWLIWEFSENVRSTWSPTVRPPRLGGNKRMGVFATRSPFRPNPLGLSSVRLLSVELHTPEGPVLHISGADLMNGTPIYDIKPYIPYTDSHPEARSGFAPTPANSLLNVKCPEEFLSEIPTLLQCPLLEILAHDPRPSYQHDPNRLYVLPFDVFEVQFQVCDDILTVVNITPLAK